ncbi:MAG: ImmA/IrrE family metallo-endopeptidase [Phenylobacterium sp.]|jgi:Zn-dependent peptidase ImmA (M78 family)|uniref:ImmA/IrrE family metallo-endopeptidase n=1 Tax=Phenylobacterium sp. TaxID=1871053 RepID=UPI00391F6A3D|nr:ImmA/IrrE family metallo-endopeptidase [Sediminibacterium sp.]
MNMSVDPLKLAERYWGDIPVPIFTILEELGLGPDFTLMDDDFSGWIERRADDTYRVAINAMHAPVRKRFTAAHELGHFIFHRDLLGAGVGDTRAYRAAGTRLPNAAIRPVHERQANSFAANLLMPLASIRALRAQGVCTVPELAERLEVSQAAMRIRLGKPLVASQST